jgi:hypothetical protein
MLFVQSRGNKPSQSTLDGDWADVVPAKSVGGSMRQLGGLMRYSSMEHRWNVDDLVFRSRESIVIYEFSSVQLSSVQFDCL